MNIPARPPCLRFAPSVAPLLLAALFLASPALHAQVAPADVATNTARANAERQTYASARAQAKAGNLDAAEQTIGTMVRGSTGTPGWHQGCATRLLRLADQLQDEGRINLTPPLAERALRNAQQAERAATKAFDQSAARAFAGMIYERYYGDLASALQCYDAAVTMAPKNQLARQHAVRLRAQLAALTPRNSTSN